MSCFTYYSDSESELFRTVPNDKECDDLLRELRQLTEEDWIVTRHQKPQPNKWYEWFRKPKFETVYGLAVRLYLNEYQVINTYNEFGGSIFHNCGTSRQDVINFMLGLLNGVSWSRGEPIKSKSDS